MKKGLVFFLGILLGVALTVGAAFVYNKFILNDDLVMFDRPGEKMPITSMMVIQVLSDGSALATTFDSNTSHSVLLAFSGMSIVRFIPEKNMALYDNLEIKVPKKKCVRQVGTYRYQTKDETLKTVPVVRIFDK